VLQAPTSLRGASGVLEILRAHLFPQIPKAPCPNTGTAWLLRVGLYELTRPLEKADDWLWIIDHTIQLGATECFLVVGCRLSVWQADRRPLEHQDLTLLALEPVDKSNAEIVQQQLEAVVSRTGTPRAILSDGDAELRKGIRDFCEKHEQTSALSDLKHHTALVVKRLLTKDPRWDAYSKLLGQSRRQILNTPLAHLAPPKARDRCRYMNLAEFIAWGQKVRRFLEHPVAPEGKTLNVGDVNIKLGWLREWEAPLAEWSSVMRVVAESLEYVRKAGYHAHAGAELASRLSRSSSWPQGQQAAASIVSFVTEQSQAAKEGERLVGSSEVLESLIGKGKRVEGPQSRNGFTKLVLAMAASVVQPTKEFLESALATVKTKDVVAWVQEKLGCSLQAQRRAALKTPKAGTKPG
jgi:hypothetical protein